MPDGCASFGPLDHRRPASCNCTYAGSAAEPGNFCGGLAPGPRLQRSTADEPALHSAFHRPCRRCRAWQIYGISSGAVPLASLAPTRHRRIRDGSPPGVFIHRRRGRRCGGYRGPRAYEYGEPAGPAPSHAPSRCDLGPKTGFCNWLYWPHRRTLRTRGKRLDRQYRGAYLQERAALPGARRAYESQGVPAPA